jgi:tetratricopeptide (TPR) repeat protein
LKPRLILIYFFLTCLLIQVQASDLVHDSLIYIIEEYEDDSLRIQALIDFADDIDEEYPDSAFIYLQTAEEIAKEIQSNYLLSVIHVKEGVIFDQMHEYAEAMSYYLLAKKELESDIDFVQDSASRVNYLSILNQLGVLYFKIEKFEEALEYLNKLPAFMQEHNMSPDIDVNRDRYLRTYINIGAVNIRMQNYNEAEINYTKALRFLKDDDLSSYAVILNNLGIIAKETEDYNKAFDHHERALKIRIDNDDKYGICQSYNNIGATYWISGDVNNAKLNFEKSLEISREKGYIPSALISLGYLRMIHEDRRQYEKAFEYLSEATSLNDSLMNREKLRTMAQMELQDKFDTRVREAQYKQEKIESEQRRKETIYIFLTAGSLLGILVLVLFYFLQRGKMKRESLESRKNSLELEKVNLEKVNLERELEFRTKELATNVMYMARTSEFITQISEKLLKSKMYFTKENQEVINKIITELQSYVDQDTWAEFEIRFQQVHNEFYTKLNDLHPDLTANEKKLCAFLRLNMTTKEISAITYQSVNSIIVARSRLRKKLDIERDENLVSYLENL